MVRSPSMQPNGPAIWGGCVTRRSIRAESGTLAEKLSRCKEGMAHFLPSWYKFYCVMARSRYKFDRSREFIPGYKVGGGHWRSVAVQTVSEPEICQGAGFKLRADARVRVQGPLQICLGCRSKSKNRDKQLTHIVRVSSCIFN